MSEEQKKLYRYEIEYRSYDDDTQVCLREYSVVKETERTYFINPTSPTSGDKLKRVLKLEVFKSGYVQTGKYTKRFAYAKKEDAKLNFETRTKKRIAWYKFWIEECEKGLELIKTK